MSFLVMASDCVRKKINEHAHVTMATGNYMKAKSVAGFGVGDDRFSVD